MAIRAEESKELTSQDKIKLGVAGGILLLAGVVALFTFGIIGGDDQTAKPVVETPEQKEVKKQMVQQAQEEREAMQKKPGTVVAGE